jgi:hypothetical protein
MEKEFLKSEGWLYQEVIVWKIKEQFGDEFVYRNENGNLAISRPVLNEFRKLTESTATWEPGERAWRRRHSGDDPNRRAASD